MMTAKDFAENTKKAKTNYAAQLRRQFGDDAPLHRYSSFKQKRKHFDTRTMEAFAAVIQAERDWVHSLKMLMPLLPHRSLPPK